MKKRSIVCLMVAALICNSVAIPANNIQEETITVSAAVYNEVPEGYIGIYTIEDLYSIRNNLSSNYILMNDIDLSETAPGGDWDNGNGWLPIDGFSGEFNGNGHAIKNMHIYGTIGGYLGLFGNSSGRITKVALVNCDIDITVPSNSTICIGSIIGGSSNYSYPRTTYCYATGSIKVAINCSSYVEKYQDYFVGGIGGDAKVDDAFNNCDIYVSVTDDNSETHPDRKNYFNVGGITGYSGHVLSGGSSYSTGKCLYNAGVIEIKEDDGLGEYRIGNIFSNSNGVSGSISNCYYLKTTSEYTAVHSVSDSTFSNVVGLTAGQMKSQSAFMGFDFDDVWKIDPNAEYPYPTLKEVTYVSSGSSQTPTEPEQSTTNPSIDSSQKGDINGDGKVDAADAAIILIYAAMRGAGYNISIDDLY